LWRTSSAFLSPTTPLNTYCYSAMDKVEFKAQGEDNELNVAASALESARICGRLKTTLRTGW